MQFTMTENQARILYSMKFHHKNNLLVGLAICWNLPLDVIVGFKAPLSNYSDQFDNIS